MVELKEQKNGLWVTFLLHVEGETAVVKGAWDGWEDHEMRRKRDGSFYLRKKIPPGEWQFGYELDSVVWLADDTSPQVPGPFGSSNSTLTVGGKL